MYDLRARLPELSGGACRLARRFPGRVHPQIDPEFEANLEATIAEKQPLRFQWRHCRGARKLSPRDGTQFTPARLHSRFPAGELNAPPDKALSSNRRRHGDRGILVHQLNWHGRNDSRRDCTDYCCYRCVEHPGRSGASVAAWAAALGWSALAWPSLLRGLSLLSALLRVRLWLSLLSATWN
jgi:hypothetical protein